MTQEKFSCYLFRVAKTSLAPPTTKWPLWTFFTMGRINIELDEELHRKAKSISALKGLTLFEYINKAIEEKLRTEKL